MFNSVKVGGVFLLAASLVGCSQSSEPVSQSGGTAATPDATFLLADMPTDVQGVEQARKDSQNDEQVAVEGRIGGVAEPFVDGIAAFTLIHTQLRWCADDEGCPTPWDYCCSDKTGKLATVKIVGPDGQA